MSLTDEQIMELAKLNCSIHGHVFPTQFARAIEAEVKNVMCDAIKAEDDHCADGDYMMDSDDCISVIRGEWNRTDYSCGEKK